MKKDRVRKLALRLLRAWESEDKYVNLLLDSPMTAELTGEERRFLTALLYGTVERLITLDFWIERLTGKTADRLAPGTRALLRLGLYQLRFMDSVPDFAAVHETVALAAHEGERRFVNGVLRAAQREPARLAFPAKEEDPVYALSIAHSFPREIVSLFLAQYGEEMTARLLSAFNETAPLTLRVNTKKISRDALLARLSEAGYAAEPTAYSVVGIRLSDAADPKALPGFAEGLFYIQDEASQIAVAALGAKDASLSVDTCAAPGGKSFGIAMDMEGGRVVALDLHASKLSLITGGAARLGLSDKIAVTEHNGEEPLPSLIGCADAVLCDAPCSGLGVLGKKADLRHRGGERLSELPPLQKRILSSAAAYVKEGGALLYSTCTLHGAENEGVARAFLETHPDFSAEDFSVGDLTSKDGMLTLLPPIHKTDGFFIAKFRKNRK